MPKHRPEVDVWVVDTERPWRIVKHAKGTIHGKLVFIPDRYNRELHRVIGVSVFFSPDLAEKRRLGLIDRMLATTHPSILTRFLHLDPLELEVLLKGRHYYKSKYPRKELPK